MKIKLNKYILLLLASLTLVMSSCSDIDEDSTTVNEQKTKTSSETISEAAKIDDTTTAPIAYLTIGIGETTAKTGSSRTALPDFSDNLDAYYAGFTKFRLTGAIEGSEEEVIRVWETTTDSDQHTTNAYTKLTTTSSVPLKLFTAEVNNTSETSATENWNFTLTAWYGDPEEAIGKFTRFKATLSKEICAGATNPLEFTLTRDSAYGFNANATGEIAITLNYKATVPKTVIYLYSQSDTARETPLRTTTVATMASGATYVYKAVADNDTSDSATAVPEGKYTVVIKTFDVYENRPDVPKGEILEYVYVMQGLTSKSSFDLNMNESYSITYKYTVIDGTSVNVNADFAESNFTLANEASGSTYTIPYYYSRLETVTLPKASNIGSPISNNYVFCGWYENYDTQTNTFSGSPILEIERNSHAKALTLYGKFIDKREAETIDSVALYLEGKTSDGTETTVLSDMSVGHKLTATAKVGTTDFEGTIVGWKWYTGEIPSEQSDISWNSAPVYDSLANIGNAFTPAVNTELAGSITEINTTADSTEGAANKVTKLVTTSSLKLIPAWKGKYIKATAVQKYTVRAYTEDDAENYAALNTAGVKKVVENTFATATTENALLDAIATENEIAAGNLAVSTDFSLWYGTLGDTNAQDVVEINSELYPSGKLFVGAGTVHDITQTDWVYGATTYQTACTFELAHGEEDTIYAPTSSGYKSAKVSVANYTDLSLTDDNGAFIRVKYAVPTEADILTTLWSSSNGTGGNTSALEGFDKGYISFKETSFVHDYDTNRYDDVHVYADTPASFVYGDSVSPVARTTLGGARRAAADFAENETAAITDVFVGDTSSNSLVFTVLSHAGTNDTKGNPEGAIDAPSSTCTVAFTGDNATNYVGTRVMLASVSVTGTSAVGNTITITPLDSAGNAITDYDASFTYSLKRADNEPVSAQPTDGNTGSYIIKQEDFTSDSTDDDATDTLNISVSRTYVYDGAVSVPTTTTIAKGIIKSYGEATVILTQTEGSGTAVINTADFAISVTYTGSALIEGASPTSGTIAWTADTTLVLKDSVSGVDLATSGTFAPVVGFADNETVVTYDDSGITKAKAKIKIVAKGYKVFTANDLYVAIPLAATPPTVLLRTDTNNISYGKVKFDTTTAYMYEYSLDGGTTWYNVPATEFANPFSDVTLNNNQFTFSVRTKRVGKTTSATYYYSTEQDKWLTDTGVEYAEGNIASLVITAASAPADVTYTASRESGTGNQGNRGMPHPTVTFVAQDMKLNAPIKSGNIITITPAGGYTVKNWYIDGLTPEEFAATDSDITVKTESVPGDITVSEESLVLDITDFGSGTYQITAVMENNTTGITYSAGVSVVVSQ